MEAAEAREPMRLEGAVAAWMSRCGHLAYVRVAAGGQELLLREPDQSERMLARTDGAADDRWTWAQRVHFSERGDQLYLDLAFGSTTSPPSLTAIDLFTREQVSRPEAHLDRLVHCLGTDYLVQCRGDQLLVYDSKLDTVAQHQLRCGSVWSDPRDCKVFVGGATLRVVQLDRQAEPITLPALTLSSLGTERYVSVPNQPYVLHGAFDQTYCGDTTCLTFGLTELLDLRAGGKVVFTSPAMGDKLEESILQSDPPGKVALLSLARQHFVIDGEERLTELEELVPLALLRDQVTLLANRRLSGYKWEQGRYRLPSRVTSAESIELEGTLQLGTLSRDERRVAWLRNNPDDAREATLVVAPLDSPSAAQDIRSVPAALVLLWVGNTGYALLWAPEVLFPPPGAEDLAEPGYYLLDPQGQVVQFWKRDHAPELHDAAGHVVAVFGAEGTEIRSATIIDVATGAITSLGGTMRMLQGFPELSLDQSATRYLLSLDDGFWTGSFGE